MNTTLAHGSGEFVDPATESAYQTEHLDTFARRAKLTATWLTGTWLAYGVVEIVTLSGRDLVVALAVRALCVVGVLPVIWRTYTEPRALHRDTGLGAGSFFGGCVLFILLNPHPWVDVQAPAWVAFTLMVHTLMELHAWRHLVMLNTAFAGASVAAWMHRVDAAQGEIVAAGYAIGGALLASVVAAAFLNARDRTGWVHLQQSKALEQGRAVLLSAVAHELRTPLARFRMGLSLARRKGDIGPLEEADRQLDQLDTLITELVRFGQIVPGELLPRQDEVSADALVDDAVALARGTTPPRELTVDMPPIPLRVHEDLLRSALTNLVANALRHATRRVSVSAAEEGGAVVFRVEDDGPGIPPAARAEVFQPFRRLDPARSRDKGGVGLGLAVVARVVEAHGGRVTIDDSPLGGARFELHLPPPP